MNITLKEAKRLISTGVSYTVFPSYCAYRTVEAIEGALNAGYIADLVVDHYEEEGDVEELDDDDQWNSGEWVVTAPERIELIVTARECETWEEREIRLVG